MFWAITLRHFKKITKNCKTKMEKYQKGENLDFIQDTIKIVLSELEKVFPEEINVETKVMHVKGGSKLRNLIPVATNQCTAQGFSILVGSGNAVQKLISLAEVLKRRSKKMVLLQANCLRFTTVEEIWTPLDEQEDLDALKVVRQIPFMAIFLVAKSDVKASALTKFASDNAFWSVQAKKLSTFIKADNEVKRVKRKRT